MASKPMYLDFTQEVDTATPGDTLGNSAKGLILFPEGGSWYSKDSAGVVKALAGLTAATATDGTLVETTTGSSIDYKRAAITGDAAIPAGSNISTLATLLSGGSVGSAGVVPAVTFDSKGRLTAVTGVAITPAAIGAAVSSRLINTTAPLTGGGDLTADRTLAISAATITTPGSLAAADKVAVNTTLGKDATGANPTVFRPGDYAAGNTYDPTGTADSTTSFQAAINAMVAFNGRALFQMPPGVFKVNSNVFKSFATPCSIKGSGRGTTVLIPANGTNDFIQLPSAGDGVEIGDFAIFNTSGVPFTTNAGINTNGCDDVVIHDMQFVDLFYDINVNNTTIKCSIQRTIHFQTNGNASSVGVIVTNGAAGDTYIGPDIVMSNTGATRRRASVEIVQSGHFEINQCNLTGGQYGTIIDPGAGQIVAFGFISETLNDSCTVAAMLLNAATSTSTIKNIKSQNAWYSGTVSGVGTSGVITEGVAGGIINGITFSNDRMLNNQQHGFLHQYGTDFRWADCDMKGNSAQTANTYDALNVAAAVSNWSVNGGKFGGTDTAITGNQRYGINVAAGAGDYIKISPDDLSGNSTGPLSNGATGQNVFVNGCPGLCPGRFNGADVATTGTTAATLAQVRIPANSVRIGTMLRIRIIGQSSSTGTLTASVRAGATNDAEGAAATNAVAYTTAASAAQVANTYAQYEFYVRVTALGAGTGRIDVGLGYAAATAVAITQTTAARAAGAGFLATLTTTADWYLSCAVACTVGTFTAVTSSIEVLAY